VPNAKVLGDTVSAVGPGGSGVGVGVGVRGGGVGVPVGVGVDGVLVGLIEGVGLPDGVGVGVWDVVEISKTVPESVSCVPPAWVVP
jgi:hypothetical protein